MLSIYNCLKGNEGKPSVFLSDTSGFLTYPFSGSEGQGLPSPATEREKVKTFSLYFTTYSVQMADQRNALAIGLSIYNIPVHWRIDETPIPVLQK